MIINPNVIFVLNSVAFCFCLHDYVYLCRENNGTTDIS